MTLKTYQKHIDKLYKNDMWWGGLTVELCGAVGKLCRTWTSVMKMPTNTEECSFKDICDKLTVDIVVILSILARLAHSADSSIDTLYKYAHHDRMGQSNTSDYILRMVSSAGSFLNVQLLKEHRDYKKIIEDNVILVLHDLINVVHSIDPMITMELLAGRSIQMLSKNNKKKDKEHNV